MSDNVIYLDHAATAPLRAEVLDAMLPYLQEHYGNPSSLHRLGRRTRQAISEAREHVAALLEADPREIIFTSGGTESDNLAIGGVLHSGRGKCFAPATEHHAVLHGLERWHPASSDTLDVDSEGRIDPAALDAKLTDDTALVSVMAGNNETGVMNPIQEIACRCRERGIRFHSDAVQAAAYHAIDVREVPADLLSLSAHKIGGPKGIGALYARRGVRLAPLIVGGGQEKKRRAGTECVASIVGFGAACALARAEREEAARRMTSLRRRLEAGVFARIQACWINGGSAERLPHISNIGFAGVEGEGILYGLDAEGICVSTGSACTSGVADPSHVLRAMGQSHEQAVSAVRFSLGHGNTEADIDRLLNVLPRVVDTLRERSG